MVSLGWALGMFSVVFFASTAIYSGVLLTRVRAMYPTATGYADLAHRLGGLHFGVFTNCCILFNWSFLLPYYLMACANGLVIAMYDSDACVKGDSKLVTSMLRKLSSKAAKYRFLKSNINIRVKGFGWTWAHHAWISTSHYCTSDLPRRNPPGRLRVREADHIVSRDGRTEMTISRLSSCLRASRGARISGSCV